jgi:murein L,D-transpeptidase YcbB/YkuD
MRKIYILLLVFATFGCEKEPKKIKPISKPIIIPHIQVEGKSVAIDSVLLNSYSSKNLKEFYLFTGYKSVWQSEEDRNIILQQFISSEDEGLNPKDYNCISLKKYEKKYNVLQDQERAKYDILFTHSLQKYILHLKRGRMNPNYLYKNWDLQRNSIDINQTIAQLLKSDSLYYKINQLKPNHIVYNSLKKALKIIENYPVDDFTPIAFENKIVLNDTNPTLIEIKKRLIYWKEMKPVDSLSNIYDTETNVAMRKFQIRHGLAADGVIGKGTVDALNFSRRQRKEQILVNLERWKWYPPDMGTEYVVVNIPDYKLTIVKDQDTMRTHKVIVGRDKRPTPILSSRLSGVILNPTWTVPPTILKEDVIPAIARNRNYLVQTNIKVYNSNGNEVSARNWKLSDAKGYRYVQSPGVFNSLGMVKFVFSNRFSIYLHDTNHRDFFGKQIRSLSSGCVRVENPLKLAEYLLTDEGNWDIEKITKTLQNGKTKGVQIKKEVKIHILYWTAWADNNHLIFRDDIYNLDADLYRKL